MAEETIEVEVVEVEVEEVKYCAIGAEASYLKSKPIIKWLNVPIKKQAKDNWWKSQLGNAQGETSAPQPENKEN